MRWSVNAWLDLGNLDVYIRFFFFFVQKGKGNLLSLYFWTYDGQLINIIYEVVQWLQSRRKKKILNDQSNNNFRSVNIGKFGTWSQIVGTRMLLWVLTPFNDKIEFYHVYPKKKKNDKIALFGSSISFEIWSVLHTINKPCEYIIKIIWVIELYKSILHLIRV